MSFALSGPPAVGPAARSRPGGDPPGRRVVVVAEAGETRAAVESLAAATGVPVRRLGSPESFEDEASGSTLVVVDVELVRRMSPRPHRAGVVVVAARAATGEEWAAAMELGAERILRLPEDEHLLVNRLAEFADGDLRQAVVVGFVGGRGGAGASVLAAAFARVAARRGLETLLVDCDPLGGGLDLLLGAEDIEGLRWPGLAGVRGRLPAGVVPLGLPRVDGVWLLSCDRAASSTLEDESTRGPDRPQEAIPAAAVGPVLGAGRRRMDLVVLDLPRWGLEALVESRCDVVHLVTPAEVNAVAAAHRVAVDLARAQPTARRSVVVRGPAQGGVRAETVAEVLGLPLAGFLRPEPGLRGGLERREPPGLRVRGPLGSLSRRLLASVLDEHGWGSGGLLATG